MVISFLIGLNHAPRFTKKEVDQGNISKHLSGICDAIRAVFFTSGAMRKERNLFLHALNEKYLYTFKGKTLRYLGPDERSILMLLLKANDSVVRSGKGTEQVLRESTPGIQVGINFSWDLALDAFMRAHTGYKVNFLTINEEKNGERPAITFPRDGLNRSNDLGTAIVITEHEWNGSLGDREEMKRRGITPLPLGTPRDLKKPSTIILMVNLFEDTSCNR